MGVNIKAVQCSPGGIHCEGLFSSIKYLVSSSAWQPHNT